MKVRRFHDKNRNLLRTRQGDEQELVELALNAGPWMKAPFKDRIKVERMILSHEDHEPAYNKLVVATEPLPDWSREMKLAMKLRDMYKANMNRAQTGTRMWLRAKEDYERENLKIEQLIRDGKDYNYEVNA